jgi:hypothetical protein
MTYLSLGESAESRPIFYTNKNLSRFYTLRVASAMETVTFSPATSQRFTFSVFGVYCEGKTFITNRANANYTFWQSLPKLSCSSTPHLYTIINLTSSYLLSSTHPVDAISLNGSVHVGPIPTQFTAPALLHFRTLSCRDNFTFSIKSDSAQNFPIEETIISESDEPATVLTPVPAAPEAQGYRVIIGVSFLVVVLSAGAAAMGLRSCVHKPARVPPRKPPRAVLDERPSDGDVPVYLDRRPIIHSESWADEPGPESAEEDPRVMVDPYRLSSANLYGNQRLPDEPIHPDSPYDAC